MRSDTLDVGAYVAEAPEERRAVLAALRDACRTELTGFAEDMAYGMPSYSRDGVVEVAFASQKNYISLYVLRSDVLERARGRLAGASCGKGCVRYAKPERVDLDVVRAMLRDTVASSGPVC